MRHQTSRIRSMIGCMVLVGGIVGTAHAQQFALQLASAPADVSPGRDVLVNVVVTGGPADTAALNFTVSANNSAGGNFVSSIASVEGSTPTGFVLAENSPARTGGKEYRAVVYAPNSSVTPISTVTARTVAQLRVRIAPEATDGATIVLNVDRVGGNGTGFDADNFTALRGISNAAGVSIVPSGTPATNRPTAVGLTLTVRAPQLLADVVFDETTTGLMDAWTFGQSYPETSGSFPGSNPVRVVGSLSSYYGIRTDHLYTYGFLNNNKGQLTEGTNRVVPTEDNSVMLMRWDISSNRTDASQLPQFRLRANSAIGGFGSLSIFENAVAPISTTPRTFVTAMFIDPSVLASPNPGVEVAFDAISGFGRTDVIGSELRLHRFQALEEIPVADLSTLNPTSVFNWTFADDSSTGWNFLFLPEANGGVTVAQSTSGGLGVATPGTPVLGPPTGAFTLGNYNPATGAWDYLRYGFGWWERQLTTTEFAAVGGKLYRVDVRVSSTDATPPTARFRLNFQTPAFLPYFTTELTIANDSRKPEFTPTPAGSMYTTFFVAPAEINGMAPKIAFDVYKVNPASTGTPALQEVQITQYDMPPM